jgi:hypothetical protein
LAIDIHVISTLAGAADTLMDEMHVMATMVNRTILFFTADLLA